MRRSMSTLTPLENLRMLLDGGRPEWIPFSLDVGSQAGFSDPVMRTFAAETGSDDPAEYFDTDVRRFSLATQFGGDDPAALHQGVEPGTVFEGQSGIYVTTGKGTIRLVTVQPAGKQAMPVAALVNGQPELLGAQLQRDL